MIEKSCWKGLEAIVCIASTDKPVSLQDICEKSQIAKSLATRFLEQFQRHGWIKRAQSQSYVMRVNPMRVSALEVMKASHVSGVKKGKRHFKENSPKQTWDRLESDVYKLLQSKTLAELIPV